jgi:hypothetical protein
MEVRDYTIGELLSAMPNVKAKEHGITVKDFRELLKTLNYEYESNKWVYKGENEKHLDELLSTYWVKTSKPKNPKEHKRTSAKNTEVQQSTLTNHDFTEEEKRVLKLLINEHNKDYKLFREYRVYEELSKVPINAEQVRSAFNMSKETTERLKKYASERRLPLQDLVELAVINLLDQYDKK